LRKRSDGSRSRRTLSTRARRPKSNRRRAKLVAITPSKVTPTTAVGYTAR
jgi:hypothetical protein